MTTTPQFNAIFDFDGVLADSAPLIVNVLDRMLRFERGLTFSDEDLRRTVGPPFREAVARLCAVSAIEVDEQSIEEIVAEFRAEYGRRVAGETLLFTGMPEVFEAIEGSAHLSICSSKPRPLIDVILAAWGIGDTFRDIEAPAVGDHESKTEGLARLLQRLPAPSNRSALIGDTVFDAEAAAANTVAFVGVAWGIGDIDELKQAGAIWIAQTPAELATIILELAE